MKVNCHDRLRVIPGDKLFFGLLERTLIEGEIYMPIFFSEAFLQLKEELLGIRLSQQPEWIVRNP